MANFKNENRQLKITIEGLQSEISGLKDVDGKYASMVQENQQLQDLLTEKFKENEALRTKLTDSELKGMITIELETTVE